VIGITIGTFIGSISLVFCGVFLYKRNKNKKESKKVILIPRNEEDTSHEVLDIPTIRNVNNYGQEIISTTSKISNIYKENLLPKLPVAENENSTNNEFYNHGNEIDHHYKISM